MKKILLGLVALSSLSFSKEAIPAPVRAVEPAIAAYVASPYLTLRVGGDIAPRYDKATLGYNNNFISEDFSGILDAHSGVLGKSLNSKNAKGFGFEVAAEYMYPIHQLPGLELGLGLAFQRHGKLNSIYNGFTTTGEDFNELHPDFELALDSILSINTEREIPSFDSMPLYVVGKYKFDNWDMWGTGAIFYLKGDLGWSYNMKKGETKSTISGSLITSEDTEAPATFSDNRAYLAMNGNSKIENGLYWGAGFGVEYDNWTVDLMYKVNTAKIKGNYSLPAGVSVDGNSLFENRASSFSESLNYSRVTLSLGYKF